MNISHHTIPSQGKILLADPFMSNPSFRRSVVFLAEYGPAGSVGFVLNRPTDFMFNDIVEGFPHFPARVYLGGPVESGNLHFLHRIPNLPESYEAGKGIYWGGSLDALREMMDAGSLSPSDVRFFIGYSGWEPNQLDEELSQKNWIIAPGNRPFIFSDQPASLWSRLMKSLGEEYALLVHSPRHPSLN